MRSAVAVATAALCFAALHGVALAAPRTFVKSDGNDINPCTLAAPCRGFAAAITAADAGGEVVVLDSAGYGPVTITKSISIVAPAGVYAGVSVTSGNGITINAPSIVVALRGLSINGQGGANGIQLLQGAGLVVERCAMANFTGGGIVIGGGPAFVAVSQSTSSNNTNGIDINAGADNGIVAVSDSRFESNSQSGILVQASGKFAIDRTTMSRNGVAGLNVSVSHPAGVHVAVDRSSAVSGAGKGIAVTTSGATSIAIVSITRTTIAQNQYGLFVDTLLGGGTRVGITDSDVVDTQLDGITATGATTEIHASRNRVMRSGSSGFKEASGGKLFTPGTNYVRDNGVDDGGHTSDVGGLQ